MKILIDNSENDEEVEVDIPFVPRKGDYIKYKSIIEDEILYCEVSYVDIYINEKNITSHIKVTVHPED